MRYAGVKLRGVRDGYGARNPQVFFFGELHESATIIDDAVMLRRPKRAFDERTDGCAGISQQLLGEVQAVKVPRSKVISGDKESRICSRDGVFERSQRSQTTVDEGSADDAGLGNRVVGRADDFDSAADVGQGYGEPRGRKPARRGGDQDRRFQLFPTSHLLVEVRLQSWQELPRKYLATPQ